MTIASAVYQRLQALPVLLACIALFAMMIMTFTDVIFRSVFNSPIESATELTRLFMAIIVFSVLPIISGRGDHIVVDLADSLFTRKAAHYRDVFVSLACGVMLWWPTLVVIKLSERARSYGDVTEYLNFPQYLIGWFIAIAIGITGIVLVLNGLILFFKPKFLEQKND